MEGIYFESSATTDYHFLTVSECSRAPVEPGARARLRHARHRLRPLRAPPADARRPLLHGVDAGDAEARRREPDLTLVKDIPQNPSISGAGARQGAEGLEGVRGRRTATSSSGIDHEPVVLTSLPSGPKYSKCWNQAWTTATAPSRSMQDGWECTTAPWWVNRDELDTAYAQTGPSSWQRVKASDLATAQPRAVDADAGRATCRRRVDKISFDVSEIGKPVEVKESYFPNWQVTGAEGSVPARAEPDGRRPDVDARRVDVRTHAGRLARPRRSPSAALVGLVLLGLWTGARRFAAGDDDRARRDPTVRRHGRRRPTTSPASRTTARRRRPAEPARPARRAGRRIRPTASRPIGRNRRRRYHDPALRPEPLLGSG